jgi:tetratricopeptide (TPR) repeat protein
MKRALVFALVLTLSATGAWADRYDDCKQSGDPDRKIRGCTQIIERGEQETQKKRANAYSNRGFAYDDKGEYDKAIADFDKAIALDPNDGEAYKNRGAAYRRTGTVKVGALAPKRMRNVFVVPPSVMLNVTGALAPARMRNVSALGQKVLPPLTFPASHRSQRSSRGHRMHRRRASFPMVMEGSKPIRFIIPIARLAESAAMLE